MNNKNYRDYTPRQSGIIKLFAAISGTKEIDEIIRYLNKSLIFVEIGKGNSVYLYDSSSANLVEIVDELRESIGSQLDSERITEKSISKYNTDRRLDEVLPTALKVTAKTPIILSKVMEHKKPKKHKKSKKLITVPINIIDTSAVKNRNSLAGKSAYARTTDIKNKTKLSKRKSNSKNRRDTTGIRKKK